MPETSRPGRPERPLDQTDGPLSRFAHELRQLRAAAGYPSYRDLAAKALFSASVLSTAASGFSLPTLRVTLAYARACDGDIGEWQRRWKAAAADLARRPGSAVATGRPARCDHRRGQAHAAHFACRTLRVGGSRL